MNIYIKHIVVIVVSLSFMLGCSDTDACFTDNMLCYDREDVEVVHLQGKPLLNHLMGVTDVSLVGNYLCLVTPQLKNMLHIYNVQGDLLASMCVKGNGPNDFINMQLRGQTREDETGCYLWVNDVSSAMLKRIDLTRSVNESACRVDKNVKTYPMSTNAFYVNDSVVVQEVMMPDNYELFTCVNGEPVEHEKIYSIDVMNPFSFYKSSMRLDMSSFLLVSAMNSFNQVNFWNLRTGERISSRFGDSVDMSTLLDEETGLEKWVYYVDVELANDQVYALFLNQSQEEAFEKGEKVEIHQFDHSGHLLRILELDRYAYSFCIDSNASVLYALVDDSQIYSYQL